MKDKITKEKLEKYFFVTEKALDIVKKSIKGKNSEDPRNNKFVGDFLTMIHCYLSDAKYFYKNKDFINAFAALNYCHGWLDAGARAKIFDVNNSTFFTVDET